MIYSELTFLIFFLPLSVFLYYITPIKHRNLTLLILSAGFYFLLEPYFLPVLAVAVAFNYLYSVAAEKFSEHKKLKTAFFTAAAAFNLLILIGFRYIPAATNKFISPVGVTFFVLNSLSYITDIYKGNAKKAKNIVSFGVYSLLFPVIVGGPVLRYGDIAPQLEFRTENHARTADGICLFIRGLAKKVILANGLFSLCAELKAGGFSEMSVLSSWIYIISFGLTVLFEFSAFSDMACGLAEIFGFHIGKNFREPLSSKSVSSFSSKFNISLNGFLLNYVYTPLSKGRGKLASSLSFMLISVLMSLFYKAGPESLLFGLYIGAVTVIETNLLYKIRKKLPKALSYVMTYLVLALGTPLMSDNFRGALNIYKSMLYIGKNTVYDDKVLFLLLTNTALIIAAVICGTKLPQKISGVIFKKSQTLHTVLNYIFSFILLFVSVCFMVSGSECPFMFSVFG